MTSAQSLVVIIAVFLQTDMQRLKDFPLLSFLTGHPDMTYFLGPIIIIIIIIIIIDILLLLL